MLESKAAVSWIRFTLLSAVFILLCSCFSGFRRYELLERAEEYSRQGKSDLAIETYRLHIRTRLALPKRPAWENPYFYLLAIGDIQLKDGSFDQALASFELAEQNGVDKLLVSDRYRLVAGLYEKQGKRSEAIAILTRYRDRDPFFFDLIRDRIAKALTLTEDKALIP